jgi:hypothetical protein
MELGIMSKAIEQKYVDVRTMHRYLKKGLVKKSEVDTYLKSLPNEEDNFELTVFEDDDLGLGDMSDEEMAAMPPMSEEDINKFDFVDEDAD